jgi:hypothetical protein
MNATPLTRWLAPWLANEKSRFWETGSDLDLDLPRQRRSHAKSVRGVRWKAPPGEIRLVRDEDQLRAILMTIISNFVI